LLPCSAEHLIALIDQPPLHIGTVVDPDDGPVWRWGRGAAL